jgi:hypothetical protein
MQTGPATCRVSLLSLWCVRVGLGLVGVGARACVLPGV